MTHAVRLDPTEIGVAIWALLHRETDRVDVPHFIPEDRAWWHALKRVLPNAPGAPQCELVN